MPKITPKWLREGSWAVQSKLKEPMAASLHLKPPFDPDGKRMKGEYEDKEEELKAFRIIYRRWRTHVLIKRLHLIMARKNLLKRRIFWWRFKFRLRKKQAACKLRATS